MNLTRYHLFLLGGLFLMMMGPLAFTQPGPSGPGGKGGIKGPISDIVFMMMSGGNDSFEVSKAQLRERPGSTVEQQREQLLTFLQKKGITNGVMTKAVFPEYWEERMTEMRAKFANKDKQGGPPAPPGLPPTAPGSAPAVPTEDVKVQAREYQKSRMAHRGNGGQNPPSILEPVKPIKEEKGATVYRTGKMPKELPAWFEEADKDKDGQVGLYEWKATGKPVREFMAMDQNGDGFLTAEEVLRYQRATSKVNETISVGSLNVTGSSTPWQRR